MKTLKQAFRHTFIDGNATNFELMIAFLPIGIPAILLSEIGVFLAHITH